jgi:hypothetical protein
MITEQQPPRMRGGIASPALDARIKEALGFQANPVIPDNSPPMEVIPPPMSAVLRTVLEVVEELEAHGVVVTSVDIPWPDEPSLGLEDGTDLDGDEHHRFPFTINGETRIMENRHMVYRGIYIDWTCKAEGVEAVEEAAHA